MFVVSDLAGSTLACCVFSALFLTPGYVCGFLGDLFGFRRLDPAWRIVASLPLSLAVTPLIVYMSVAAKSPALAWAIFGTVQMLAVCLALGRFGHEGPREWFSSLRKIPLAAVAIAALWFTVCMLSLADLQFGQRVYFSSIALDHEFRVAVIDAITRTGIPPASPFNHLGGDVPLRYHVFWFAVCSVAQRLGAGFLNARHALNASVVWCGYALMCLIALFLRLFEGLEGAALRRRALIGVGLLSVTGLDLIPNLGFYLRREVPPADMEWWTGDQVTSWADALLWVPHHVAALVAGLTGFLLIWHAAEYGGSRRRKLVHATVAGAAFASAAGCSVYVGVALATALAAWTAYTLVRRWYPHTVLLALAGVAGIVFAAPNALRLQQSNAGGRFLTFGLWAQGVTAIPNVPLSLAATYAVEFGFFFFIGILKVRQLWVTRNVRRQDEAGLVIGGTILALCTFVRSATISNNDFGWRGFMLLQFVLLIWAAGMLDGVQDMGPKPKWLGVAYVLLLIGVASTVYQIAALRFFNVALDAGIFDPKQIKGAAGRRNSSLRTVYRQLDAILPGGAVVQSNPDTPIDYWLGLYSHRQAGSTGELCNVAMGGKIDVCRAALPMLRRLFDAGTSDPAEAAAIARMYKLDAVIISDTDQIWQNADGWIYKSKPVVDTADAKAFLFDGALLLTSN